MASSYDSSDSDSSESSSYESSSESSSYDSSSESCSSESSSDDSPLKSRSTKRTSTKASSSRKKCPTKSTKSEPKTTQAKKTQVKKRTPLANKDVNSSSSTTAPRKSAGSTSIAAKKTQVKKRTPLACKDENCLCSKSFKPAPRKSAGSTSIAATKTQVKKKTTLACKDENCLCSKSFKPAPRKSAGITNIDSSLLKYDLDKLLAKFDNRYFDGVVVKGKTTVTWSKRLTSSSGNCSTDKPPHIQLSEPLLKNRRDKDIEETLLHEMIHAYLVVLGKDDGSGEEHGEEYLRHMRRINKAGGYNIAVDHDFELEHKSVWRCRDCKKEVSKTPSSQKWWSSHKQKCGGTFKKVK